MKKDKSDPPGLYIPLGVKRKLRCKQSPKGVLGTKGYHKNKAW